MRLIIPCRGRKHKPMKDHCHYWRSGLANPAGVAYVPYAWGVDLSKRIQSPVSSAMLSWQI
jgi:hypothetical protein